ncbi:MAG: hypothetical protein IJS44_00395 [Clostridia bacterium]|nr:hypothetical protein [Clostridia bacterium]
MKFKTNLCGCLLLCLCLALLLSACGEQKLTSATAKEILPPLVEASVPLNEIYFGNGFLPLARPDGDAPDGYYYVDTTSLGFASISEIMEATRAVFTEEYAALLFAAAFDGVAVGETVLPPRYIEGELGLCQRIGAAPYVLPTRVYDFDTLTVVRQKGDRTTLTVDTVADGKLTNIELLLTRRADSTADGGYIYRLDSPTY